MSSDDSMAAFIQQVKDGNEDAAAAIWERYFPDLVRVARQQLAGQRDRMADEEDVAVSAFASFFKAAEQGRLPNLRVVVSSPSP